MTVTSAPEEVTPEWLTATFTAAGFEGEVTSIEWVSIGAGQVGENVRFTLEVNGNCPQSVVGKFPSRDPTSKQTGVQLQNYAREVFFYDTIASTVDVPVPVVYTTEFDPESHNFVVLMEDLAPGVQINQMDECSTDQAALALEHLAGLHGPRWGDTSLTAHSLLVGQAQAPGATAFSLFQHGFLNRYEGLLNAPERLMVEEIGEINTPFSIWDGPQTLIHIDYRLDNLIFGGPRPLTVLDWQSVNLGCALNDTSYFMGTSLEPDHRSRDEKHLVKHYLDVLRSYRVKLSFNDCWALYRRNAPAGLNMAVIASMIVGETERGNAMFMTMAKRSAAMSEELGTVRLLKA